MSMISDAARAKSGPGAISIVYRPVHDGRGNGLRGLYVASLGDRDLCVARNPYVAAANILLAEGTDPETLIGGRLVELHYDVATMTLGAVANWQVSDNVVRMRKASGART